MGDAGEPVARGRLTWQGIEAFRTGDERFYQALVLQHQPALRAYCGRYAQDRDDEADLVQATLVRAWERRANYSGRGTIDGWLLTVARTVCHRAVVQRQRATCGGDRDASDCFDLDKESMLAHEQDADDERLCTVLRLSPRRLTVLVLRLGFGYSVADTAAALGLTAGTIKATLHQAREQLRSYCRMD
jgi:RNA polymerase sigma-70 factor (ECF subfamily)